jgi:hypothetical protein
MSEQDSSAPAWRAPYMSYETLVNFFDKKIGDNPVPPRIDGPFLDNYAGSVRPLLVTTLKTMGMLDGKNQVLEPLHRAARGANERKAVLRAWAEDFYAEQIELGKQHATAQMLWETFSKRGQLTGSTLRRAVIFYLALAKDVGLPVRAHFKSPKAPTSPQKSSPKPHVDSGAVKPPPKDVSDDNPDTATAERRDVILGDAGSVTVIVNVRWLDLPEDQFTKLRKLIKDIEALGASGSDGREQVEVSP